jgi:hypothetical protein
MKKVKVENKKLQLNKTKIADLTPAQIANVKGGVNAEAAFLSIISCHTNHAGSGCSGCQTCCSGGHC